MAAPASSVPAASLALRPSSPVETTAAPHAVAEASTPDASAPVLTFLPVAGRPAKPTAPAFTPVFAEPAPWGPPAPESALAWGDAASLTPTPAEVPVAVETPPAVEAPALLPASPALDATTGSVTPGEVAPLAAPEPAAPFAGELRVAASAIAGELRVAASATPTVEAADLPARLQAPLWAGRLDRTQQEQRVRVALGADGTVRLDAVRSGDGVAVQIYFTDPDLQSLAGTHADRLREALERHFAEPVRLSFSDGRSDGSSDMGGSDPQHAGGFGQPGGDAPADAAETPAPTPPTDATPAPAPSTGRFEWVG